MRRLLCLLSALIALPTASSAAQPHRSWSKLTTGNGFGFSVYDADAGKLGFFSEHPYAQPSPGVFTRNLAFDAYFGVRAGGGAAWLSERPVETVGYVEQTHAVRAAQRHGPLSAETTMVAPFGLSAPAVILSLKVKNISGAAVTDAAIYALLNFHLGTGAPQPGTDGERIDWDAANQSYAETGPSGLVLHYLPIGSGAVHASSPQDLFAIGRAGGEFQGSDSSGVRADAVAGFQWSLASMAVNEERSVAVLVTLGSAADGRAYLAGRDANAVVQAEVDAWNAWRKPPPAGLSPAETRNHRQAESVLRMAQSREAAPSAGQIVAALPPGQWWISWVRDQAYAIAALARMGHLDEARAAVAFWNTGRVGNYKRYVGVDYAVSVVRYYGDGEEWSDTDNDGPNVELDGFGLAAWAARLAGSADLDSAATPLLKLGDETGLIMADSSIWERHWNGKQKHFAYTSITAAAGLCAVGQQAPAKALRDSIVKQLTSRTGGLASSFEELRDQAGALDASTVEAINLGLIDPLGPLAQATLAQLDLLRAATGRGFYRNDDGSGYDKQEWVFIDLRASSALRRAGRTFDADNLLSWVTQQADANSGLQAELYDAAAADYVGAIPMVGFGAGAYVLALADRAGADARPACFTEAILPASKAGCATAGESPWAALVAVALVFWRRRPGAGTAAVAPARKRSVAGLTAAVALCAVLAAGCTHGDGGSTSDAGPDAGTFDAGPTLKGPPARDCSTTLRWALNRSAGRVSVAGEWNQFSLSADPMTDDLGSGTWRATLQLPAGDYGYKLVADGQYSLDPSNPLSKYVGGVENSRLIVEDCALPDLRAARVQAFADGRFEVDATLLDGAGRAGIDAASVAVQIDGAPSTAMTFEAASGSVRVRASGLGTGKHTARITAADTAGRAARALIIPFWIESEPFSFSDGSIYLVFVDRFRNGEPANDAPIAGVDAKANYQGGDLKGVLAALNEDYFDALGVRTLWLSPVNAGPDAAGAGTDGHTYSNYHGYWSAAPRAVERRFGSLDDLRAVTAEAHRRGLRVVLDLVQNDLHQSHPYYRDHFQDGWFHGDGSCVCGAANCDFDSHALECWFAPYLADVDFRNTAAADQLAEDAAFWLTDANVDGFRIDAVKHMEHAALTTLRARLGKLEAAGQRHLMLGETFSGDRGLIASYIGPAQLTGQFDFALFYAIDSALAGGQGTMADLDAAVVASEQAFAGLQMSPFLGNHDVPRFLSRAAGDVNLSSGSDVAWNHPPAAPTADEPYQKMLVAQAFVLTQPGVPLIAWGDEFGQPGAGDPDNRRFLRRGNELSAREATLLAKVRAIGKARATHPGLKRGARRTLSAQGDVYVYARGAGPDLAIIALNRGSSSQTIHAAIPIELGRPAGALHDVLGGPDKDVSGGSLDLTLPPRSAAILLK